MPLVDYESSESDTEQDNPSTVKQGTLKRNRQPHIEVKTASRSGLPPLPSAFHDLYASAARVSTRDDPALHDGRERAVPHMEGHWPTHVFLEWRPPLAELQILETLVRDVNRGDSNKVHSLLRSDLGAPLPLHISLSSPLNLTTEQREPFLAALRVATAGMFSTELACLEFEDLTWVSNEQSTRRFYILKVRRPRDDALNKLLQACNAVADSFHQPKLYEKTPPSRAHKIEQGGRTRHNQSDFSDHFHFSIAWSLQTLKGNSDTPANKTTSTQIPSAVASVRACCNELKVKIGNSVTSLSVSNDWARTKSVLE